MELTHPDPRTLERAAEQLAGHLRNYTGVTDVDDDVITDLQVFMLQHEQADVAFYPLRLTARVEAVDLFDLHRDTETHLLLPCRVTCGAKKG